MRNAALFLLISIVYWGCERDIDISEFSDDFDFYNPELRIEAIIYPVENTALVRIDQSVRIDEANLFDCDDNDGDWNYYYCEETDSSFESRTECLEGCETESCQQHLYACMDYDCEIDCPLITFPTQSLCKTNCLFKCVTDDTGSDGILTPENGGGFGMITPDEDGSENNGIPDCNEPNVDEYNEILPDIHVQECAVTISHEIEGECNFVFDENAGQFLEFTGKHQDEFEIVGYGGFIPDSSQCSLDFNHYNSEYVLHVDCTQISDFESYGEITAQTLIQKPAIIFSSDNKDSIITCSEIFNEDDDIFNCMQSYQFSPEDTLYFLAAPLSGELDSILDHWEDELDTSFIYDGFDDEEAVINYAALIETRKFQAVQYMFDEELNDYVYVHGHPDGGSDSGNNFFNNSICVMTETIVAEPIENEYRFKYIFYTFSEGFENYYFFDMLDLSDPVRTNLRDQSGNPVMGGFGSMASSTIYFQVILPEWIESEGI